MFPKNDIIDDLIRNINSCKFINLMNYEIDNFSRTIFLRGKKTMTQQHWSAFDCNLYGLRWMHG